MIENAVAVNLNKVRQGDKVQIKDNTGRRTYTIEGIVEKIHTFASGFITLLLSNKKDYYGPGDKMVLIERHII